ncbi:MAG: thiamine phosphate synthase [Candidatus Omnitrophota bacterium]
MIGYYFITDAGLSLSGNISDVKNALSAGVKFVQYRAKHLNSKDMYEEALKLRKLCKRAIFLVNDRVDIALAVNADGVHLGQYDLPYETARKLLGKKKIIGITVHKIEEAKKAQRLGADYLGVSPIFATKTKQDTGKPLGTALLRKIRNKVTVPIVAIGGINLLNAREVIDSGASGLCAISAVVTKPDVRKEILKFQELF